MMMATSRTPRATLACARCRRQKLKCDSKRPCTLCLHAGSSCEPQTVAERSRLNHKRLSQARAQKQNSTEPPPPTTPLQHQHQPHVSPLSMAYSSPSEPPNFSAITTSSMAFARTVNGDDELNDVGGDTSAQENEGVPDSNSDAFTLMTMSCPAREVMEMAFEAYFDRFNWFVLLLHRPLFLARAARILSRTRWTQDEVCDIMLLFIVAICGLQCVSKDPSWQGHRILQSHAVNASSLLQSLLKELGVHFYTIVTHSSLESYQTVMLLEVYHCYFGALNFAHHMAGVPVRVAFKLGLHHDKVKTMDETAYQVGIRCWNHAVVSELFGSMIYGPPTSLDPEFSRFRTLSELPGDESSIPSMTAALPIIASSSPSVSTLTFHILKFKMYGVIQTTLQQIKELNLQSVISMQDLRSVMQAVDQADSNLKSWRENLPAVFDPIQWGQPEPWAALQVEDLNCTADDRASRRRLALQGITLQVLHDSAVILAHRSLVQCRIAVSDNNQLSSMRLQHAPDSLRVAAEAALRMSRRSIDLFEHHLALSFVLMHFFTAGVILCVPPIHLPYSPLATEAKAGVLRIITASRAMSSTNSIARHTDRVLTILYRKTIQREMDGALRGVEPEESDHVRTQSVNHALGNQQTRRQGAVNPMDTPSASLEVEVSSTVPLIGNDYTLGQDVTHLPSNDEQLEASVTQSMLPYLQFGFANQDETTYYGGLLSEHLDEAFGAFEQMYDLNSGIMAGNAFDDENPFSGL